MNSPLFDQNSIVAIESQLASKTKDPFGKVMIRDFTNLFIYSNNARFPMPIKDHTYTKKDIRILPSLLRKLIKEEPGFFMPVTYSTEEHEVLKSKFLLNSFNDFINYLDIHINTIKLYQWLLTHNSKYIHQLISQQTTKGYSTYDIEILRKKVDLKKIITQLNKKLPNDSLSKKQIIRQSKYSFVDEKGITKHGLLYAFDNILRYSKYGKLVGPNEYYLSHPLRREVNFKSISKIKKNSKSSEYIFSFGDKVATMADHISVDDYVALLLLLKEEVWKHNLNKIRNKTELDNEIFKKIIFDISSKAGFPANLKPIVKKGINITGAAVSVSGQFAPTLNPIISIGGFAIILIGNIWENELTNIAARTKWLKWSVSYET